MSLLNLFICGSFFEKKNHNCHSEIETSTFFKINSGQKKFYLVEKNVNLNYIL